MTVVIHEIKFFLWNFLDQDDNKRKNLYIHAYLKDKNDWYTIQVYETEDYCVVEDENPLLELTIDSKGIDWEMLNLQNVAKSTYIGREVYNILFKNKGKGIIREYYISTTRRGEVVVENVGRDKAEQPVFVVHEVSMEIPNYPIEKGKTANIYVDTFINATYIGEHDWYFSHVYVEDNRQPTLILHSKSSITEWGSYTRVEGGKRTKLDTEIIKILKDDEVQGIIRPFSV